MRFTDERVKVMNEVISGMKVIKLYTWEDSFADLISKIRAYAVSIVRFLFLRISRTLSYKNLLTEL